MGENFQPIWWTTFESRTPDANPMFIWKMGRSLRSSSRRKASQCLTCSIPRKYSSGHSTCFSSGTRLRFATTGCHTVPQVSWEIHTPTFACQSSLKFQVSLLKNRPRNSDDLWGPYWKNSLLSALKASIFHAFFQLWKWNAFSLILPYFSCFFHQQWKCCKIQI